MMSARESAFVEEPTVMGSRANLIVMHETGYSLYYCHSCANTLPFDLLWGPAYAESFIQQQQAVSDDELLDPTWDEGADVFDPQKKMHLFFGGEDILFEMLMRRDYLEMQGFL